jgi:selenocysteine lyase/cysteine desulfurase
MITKTLPLFFRVKGFAIMEKRLSVRGRKLPFRLEQDRLGLDAIGDRTRALGERLREDLGRLPGVTTHDLGAHRCAIVTAKVAGRSVDDVAAALGRSGINVSTTAAEHNPFDTEERGVHPLVRFSPHYYNTEAEIAQAVAAVAELASR